MKPLLVLLLCLPLLAKANDDKFVQLMTRNIDAVYKAGSLEELQAAVNTFERIAGVEKARWEPLYYAAFGLIMMATREKEGSRIDEHLDKALETIATALQLAPTESELVALEGFAHMIRVTVDPAARGQKFSAKAYGAYEKALQLNPENPRAQALMAQMEFGSAQFFHASTKSACESNDKAILAFDGTHPDNPLAPRWGKGMALEMKGRCEAGK